MKHFKKMIGLFTAIFVVSMIGCKGNENNDIRIKAPDEEKVVGDIVFNDGTAVTYTPELTLTDKQKSKAIAVIYKVDGNKAYGVGLVHAKIGLAWCLQTANGRDNNIGAIRCYLSGFAGNLSFSGDLDGSDNFAKIKETLGTNDDTGVPGNYPAFEFAENYKDQINSHVSGTVYENSWYLPTIAELYDIWKEKTVVDAASALCGGSQFGDVWCWYWSSSQFLADEFCAYIFDFKTGERANIAKESQFYVCCIRVF